MRGTPTITSDRTNSKGRHDNDHEIVASHDDPTGNTRRRTVAPLEELRDRVEPEFQDPGYQHQSHHNQADAVHGHEPHARESVGITELDAADSRAAANDDCREGA